MSQEPAAMLELDGCLRSYSDNEYPDFEQSPSPESFEGPCTSAGEPYSHSSTPSIDEVPCEGGSTLQCEQQQTWAPYSKCPFQNTSPIESQLCKGFQIGNRFEIVCIIGQGSFGCTYKALDTQTNHAEVAIKVANGRPVYSEDVQGYKFDEFLQVEWTSYQRLMAAEGVVPVTGFPRMIAAGIHCLCPADDNNDDMPMFKLSYLAMELLGPTIWQASNHLRHMQRRATTGTSDSNQEHTACKGPDLKASARAPSRAWIIKTGQGMLKALADVHVRGCIHRDVKTENFCLGPTGTNDAIRLIDFGFSRLAYGHYDFVDYEERCASFWGTPNYASLASLYSYPQTPRDDLEALTYCLYELECPRLRLPWNGTLTTNSEAARGWSMWQLEAMSKKKSKAWQAACKEGKVPAYLQGYHDYITSLQPQDVPDYEWLLMQLDYGATGKLPSRAPVQRTLADWPSPGSRYDSNEYARYAISQVAAAASKILPGTVCHVQGSKRPLPQQAAHAGERQEEDAEEQQQPANKRFRSMIYPDSDSLPMSAEEQLDSEQPLSEADCDGGGTISGSYEGPSASEEQQLSTGLDSKQELAACKQYIRPCDGKHFGTAGILSAWPVLGDSQTDLEE